MLQLRRALLALGAAGLGCCCRRLVLRRLPAASPGRRALCNRSEGAGPNGSEPPKEDAAAAAAAAAAGAENWKERSQVGQGSQLMFLFFLPRYFPLTTTLAGVSATALRGRSCSERVASPRSVRSIHDSSYLITSTAMG
uniref:Uncharacterized protein n=1 Tax=Sphaerodactylus townsendi TaxID=933632 RepID=A0ACB8G009_9SAUR